MSASLHPTFIDLFSGCGGLSLGLVRAGWRGVFAIEKNADAFSTFASNLLRPEHQGFSWPLWLPKSSHAVEDLIETYGTKLRALRGKVDLMAGGPPCQGFSTFGRRNANDPRNQLFRRYLDIVERIQPKMLLMENVRGILAPFKGDGAPRDESDEPLSYAQIIANELGRKYRIWPEIVTSKDFGVPQNRPRFILIGCRLDILGSEESDPFQMLRKMRSAFLKSKRLPLTFNTVGDALSDLRRCRHRVSAALDSPGFEQGGYGNQISAYQRLMHEGMNGGIADSHRFARHRQTTIDKFAWLQQNCAPGKTIAQSDRGKHSNKKSVVRILDAKEPAPTVTTLPDDMIHYAEPRILTVREMARLQSFPDSFHFKGKYTTGGHLRKKECPRYTQVGNAVPPLLAEAIGLMLRDFEKTAIVSDL